MTNPSEFPQPEPVQPDPAQPSQAQPQPAQPSSPYSAPPGELAGFWSRLGAYVLDQILYALVVVPFAIAGGTMIATQLDVVEGTDDLTVAGSIGLIVAGAMVIGAGVLLSAMLYVRALAVSGRTWGNRIAGIEVVNAEGIPVGWGPALLRTAVSCFGSSQFYWVGFLWMLGNNERQTWHDKVARTFVRRG